MDNDISIANDRLQLRLDQQDQCITTELAHRRSNYQRSELPLLAIEIMDRMQERVERCESYTIMQLEHQEQTLHVTVRDPFRGITVGLWLTMTDAGELEIVVPPAEVEEAKDDLYRVYAIDVLPGMMASGADGQLLLPINTGILTSPADKPAVRDRFLIYGEQERWELVPTLPIAAVQTPGGGLTAVATSGAHDMYCAVETDGQGHGQIGLHPMFRRQWIDPVDWSERSIRIAPLAPDDNIVAETAKRLRHHVIHDHGKKSLTQRAEESPECAYQQRAYTMKLFHGIQQQGIMMYGRESTHGELLFHPTLTFAQARAGLKRLRDAGLERVYLQSVGWNPRGHDGAWPTCFPIDRRLGGESGLRNMIDDAKALGYQITTHLNCASAFFSSPDFVTDHVIHDIWGEPKVIGFWGGGVKATHWGLALPEGLLEQRMHALKELGFNGMQYLDGIGNPLYINYHPRHGGPRRDHAAGINRYLDTARSTFGGVATEMGFLYCALHADSIVVPGSEWQLSLCKDEWPITALLDQRVPVWQLALHDLVTIENHGTNWAGTMSAILFGEVPRDEWSMTGNVMPILTDARIAKLKARYDLCCERFGHLVTEQLVSWERPGDGVQRTCYADGSEVVADFNDGRLWVNGGEVDCPEALQAAPRN